MKRCYIHIGVHKTGSTSIQQALGKCSDRLAQEGLYIPETGRQTPSIGAHHHLAYQLNGAPAFDRTKGNIQVLVKELSDKKPDNVLLSTEAFAFSTRHPDRLKQIRKPLIDLGYEIVWIVYLRPFPEWAESAYAEISKNYRVTRPFYQWVDDPKGALIIGLNPKRSILPLSRTGDQVILRSYAEALPNLMGDFFAQVGLPEFDTTELEGIRANSRPQILTMEFFRQVATLLEATPKPKDKSLICELATTLRRKLPESPAYQGMNDRLAAKLSKRTRPAYEELLRKFRPDATYENFFPSKEHYHEHTFENYECPVQDKLKFYRQLTRLCLKSPKPGG